MPINLKLIEAKLKAQSIAVYENSVLRVGEKEPYSYYYINYKEHKGDGCYGQVFGAKKIEVDEHENVKLSEEDYVIKLMDAKNTSRKELEREYQIQKGYIKTEESSGKFRGQYFIIMEDLGEQDFDQFKDNGLKKLNLRQRLHLLVSFLHTSNLWRLNTPTTGEPIYHLDIKYKNIVVKEMRLGSGMWEARPIDYGLAKRVEKEHDPDQMQGRAGLGGTPAFSAPEVIGSAVGTRSDIFSMVPFVAMVLGANDPISKFSTVDMFQLIHYRSVNHSNAKFKLDNLLENLIPENFPEKDKLKGSVKNVLEKMQDSYENRPTMDQLLKFFNDFYTIMIAHDADEQIVYDPDKEGFSFPLQLSHDSSQNQGQPGNAPEIQEIHVGHGELPKPLVPQKKRHPVDGIHDNEFKTAIRNLQASYTKNEIITNVELKNATDQLIRDYVELQDSKKGSDKEALDKKAISSLFTNFETACKKAKPDNVALKWAGIVIITGVCALLGVSIGGVLGATVGILAGAWAGPGAAATGILGLFKGSVTGWSIGVATSALVTGTIFGTSAGVPARCRFFKQPLYVDVINKGTAALNQKCRIRS